MNISVRSITLLLVGCVPCIAPHASAAERTTFVSGALDAWQGWHFSTDTATAGCFPPGRACIETAVPPAPIIGPGETRLPVTGRLVTENGEVRSLVLRQVGRFSTNLAHAGGRLSIAGLRWRLTEGRLAQAGAAQAQCDPPAPAACRVIANGLSDPDGADSPVDFDGIPDRFPIQLGALRLNYRPAVSIDLRNPGAISIDVASHSPAVRPLSSLFNAATVAHFTLAVDGRPPAPRQARRRGSSVRALPFSARSTRASGERATSPRLSTTISSAHARSSHEN